MAVEDGGLIAEVFPNLSMHPSKPGYAEAVVNDLDRGSRLITVADLDSATAAPADLPALGTFGLLAGGDDGLANLTDVDFAGSAAGKTGLHALDAVSPLTLLIVPGRATPVVHNAMLTYCEVTRDRGCFADPRPQRQGGHAALRPNATTAVLAVMFASIEPK